VVDRSDNSSGGHTAILVGVTAPPDDLHIDRHAGVERIALEPGSWVELVPSFVREAGREFDRLHGSLAWQQTEVLRYDHYVGDRRLGAGVRSDSSPLLRQIDLHLRARFRVRFTGVAALLYRDGEDFQGLHSDREMRWLDDTLIAIVVLGARRPFVFRQRGASIPIERVPAGSGPDDIVLTPGEGDLLVMGGACQQEWLHAVPAAPGVGEPRISLTWRWTSRRGRPDTSPTFYDGRHFSDGPRRAGSRPRPG
jgi:alkylated DNA repair dioxygenase AlkB